MNKLQKTALDEAFVSQFANLFKMLIVSYEGGDEEEGIKRFTRGLGHHMNAYEDAAAALDAYDAPTS